MDYLPNFIKLLVLFCILIHSLQNHYFEFFFYITHEFPVVSGLVLESWHFLSKAACPLLFFMLLESLYYLCICVYDKSVSSFYGAAFPVKDCPLQTCPRVAILSQLHSRCTLLFGAHANFSLYSSQ